MTITKLEDIAQAVKQNGRPVQLTLEGENFSVVLELCDFDIEEPDVNGGFSLLYNDDGASAEVRFYNENHTLAVRNSSVLELKMLYDNGDAVEIVQ